MEQPNCPIRTLEAAGMKGFPPVAKDSPSFVLQLARVETHRFDQQIRGNCSPLSRSRMRLTPIRLRTVTSPWLPATTVPINEAP